MAMWVWNIRCSYLCGGDDDHPLVEERSVAMTFALSSVTLKPLSIIHCPRSARQVSDDQYR